jgi:hypothetical protein
MTGGFYKLDCSSCLNTTKPLVRDGELRCPLCGAALGIEWGADRRELARRAVVR